MNIWKATDIVTALPAGSLRSEIQAITYQPAMIVWVNSSGDRVKISYANGRKYWVKSSRLKFAQLIETPGKIEVVRFGAHCLN